MRILHIVKSRNFAGSEQYMLTLCRALEGLGDECAVAIRPGGRLEEICRERGVTVVPVSTGSPFSWMRLSRWLSKNPMDVIHTHLTGGARIGLKVAERCGIPCCSHLHIYRTDPAYRRVAAYSKGGLIAVSSHLAKFYRDEMSVPAGKLHVVINATVVQEQEDAQIDQREAAAAVRDELGLEPAARLVLLAGRLSQGKGQDVAIRAMSNVVSQYPNTHLLLAGVAKRGTPVEGELKRLAPSECVDANVHFLGFRRDVPRLMRAAEITLLPSRMDVMPLIAVEAMRLGCCLIASRVGGLPEVVEHGRTGILVEPDSPAKLGKAICELLQNPLLSRELGEAAGRFAVSAFDAKAMGRKVEAIYRSLLSQPIKTDS